MAELAALLFVFGLYYGNVPNPLEATRASPWQSVCRKAGEGVTVEYIQVGAEIPATPIDNTNSFFSALKSTMDRLGHGFIVKGCPGNTDARFLREIGIPALGLTPLKNLQVKLHDHDEYVTEKVFLDGIDVATEILKAVANV